MKTNCFLLFLGLILLACQCKEVDKNISSPSDSNETKIDRSISIHSDGNDMEIDKNISFHSDGNDMADIKLAIDKEHTFQLDMEIFPDLEEKTDTSTFERFNGSWTKQGDCLYLKFETQGIDLTAVFAPSDNKKEILEVFDSTTVVIKKDASSIVIWGIPCYRE